ncbi:MAG: acyltransferase [Aquabacterium sp.]|uniref:acyltransferase family protein n=1 Tax=Aquabacterium sp. TaxID=1872578 RepID=UPI0027254015|nr:acyltransferase [Aquabacterium sp.]MDO9003023.1 acyltransferase [Aquabacterium sp.]
MRRFGGLEGLRAWLAWTVVFSHIMSFTGLSQLVPWLAHAVGQAADCSVMVFTILSGFVITHLLLARREPYPRYIVRRFLRIYPVYAVALLAGIGGTCLAFDTFLRHPWGDLTPATHRMLMQSESLASGDLPWHLAAHLSLLHGAVSSQVLYESQYMFLGPAWSLSLEWQFYLVAPLVVALAMHRLGQVLLVALAMWGYTLYTKGVFGEFMLPSVLPGAGLYFGVGIATRFLIKARADIAAFPLALLMLVAGLLMNTTGTSPILIWAAFVCMMLLNGKASDLVSRTARWTFAKAFDSRLVRWLGERSYATYLIHMPIVQLVTWVCVRQLGMGLVPTGVTVVLVAVPGTLIASTLLHRYVELPAIQWGRRMAWLRSSPIPEATPRPRPGTASRSA